ncbi:MerR family transcriptional regulator [Streptomyces noursei]|uniref:MerR family transcriptional regulator n=1 Tax=Streptomyces noursei TaxID=1971 RepID=UPI0035E3EF60
MELPMPHSLPNYDNPRHRLLTTKEAAAVAHVTPACIRQWVKRGYLTPTASYRRGKKVHLFLESHILKVERDRRVRQQQASKVTNHPPIDR